MLKDLLAALAVAAVPISAWIGLMVGGFLTVLVPRLAGAPPLGLRAGLAAVSAPGSHCPACRRALGWSEKLPVIGWLRVGGRCLGCGAAVPWIYPLGEAAVAMWIAAPAVAATSLGAACVGTAALAAAAVGVGLAAAARRGAAPACAVAALAALACGPGALAAAAAAVCALAAALTGDRRARALALAAAAGCLAAGPVMAAGPALVWWRLRRTPA